MIIKKVLAAGWFRPAILSVAIWCSVSNVVGIGHFTAIHVGGEAEVFVTEKARVLFTAPTAKEQKEKEREKVMSKGRLSGRA